MRPGARRRTVQAALGIIGCLPVLTALGVPLPASAARTQSPGHTGPAAASSGAAAQGGPLMASQGTEVQYPSRSTPRVPNVPASSWVIANASTGQVLAAKDPHGRFGPASTMKVLTAITLIPRLNPDRMVLASKAAAD